MITSPAPTVLRLAPVNRADPHTPTDAHRVAVVALDSVSSYELLTVLEVLGAANTAAGRELYDTRVVSTGPSAYAEMQHGAGSFRLPAEPLGLAHEADLVILPGHAAYRTTRPELLLEVLRRACDRGAEIAALGTGTFLVAASGVLDGRLATTHWAHAEELATTYPAVRLRADPLFLRDANYYTGAGGAMAIDFALHLVEEHHGPGLTAAITSRLVAAHRREGTQPQRPVRAPAEVPDDPLRLTLIWAEDHLSEGPTVADLARHAHLSRRTFDRYFRASLGTTPLNWLTRRRLRRAQELLQQTAWPTDRVARASGFHTEGSMRHHFNRLVGISPGAYRRRLQLEAAQGDQLQRRAV